MIAALVPVIVATAPVANAPPADPRTAYVTPVDGVGAVQESVRPVAVTADTAIPAGALAKVRTALAAVAAPLPDTFVAMTEKVYDVFGVSPVMVAVVPAITAEPPPVTA